MVSVYITKVSRKATTCPGLIGRSPITSIYTAGHSTKKQGKVLAIVSGGRSPVISEILPAAKARTQEFRITPCAKDYVLDPGGGIRIFPVSGNSPAEEIDARVA